MKHAHRFVLAIIATLSLSPWALAADPPAPKPAEKKEPPKPTYLTPSQSGPDYYVQGEYGSAQAGDAKYGVQVIALGDNKFRAVLYPGGLPGAGWSGNKETRIQIEGQREGAGGDVTLSGNGWTCMIRADGSYLTLKSDKDEAIKLYGIERHSPSLGAVPPKGAKVLLADKAEKEHLEKWDKAHADDRGLLAAGTRTKDKFTDHTIHLEFLLPFKPLGRGQDRGNSGVYLQDRYELQVLDSFGLDGKNNECGGFYQQHAPSVSMCLPPLVWQTYDIDFTAAKFDESGKKTAPARVTVKHNGVTIHDNVPLEKPTPGGSMSGKDTAEPGPLQLQGHGNPVFFRNVWIVEKNKKPDEKKDDEKK